MAAPTGLVRQGPPRWTITEDIHYKDIYDPLENEHHIGTRIVYECGELDDGTPITYMRYIPYEGYGRSCGEKRSFTRSINRDHPLWREENAIPKRRIPVVHFRKCDSESQVMATSEKVGVRFNEICRVRFTEDDGGESQELMDPADREERISWNFAKMLEIFVEKCSPSERKVFFQMGGNGRKWAKDQNMMDGFGNIFGWISTEKAADPAKKIAISDISVKNFPEHYYRQIEELFLAERKKKKLNPLALEFVPSKNKPKKPAGKPSRKRPAVNAAIGNQGAAMLAWSMKQENDEKFEILDRKIQELIDLQGTVVCAEMIE